jgi:predicted metal-dependent phosphoesterase TrpH
LAKQAKQSFEALGLKSYTSKDDHIGDLLHEAWKHFQAHPESYADWERRKIGELRAKFGLET